MRSALSLEHVTAVGEAPAASDSRPVLDRVKQLSPGSGERDRVVVPTLREGEQYRFHFDMTRCIGCRCCEVACNEQNNNPPEVNWRRVGDIEGGSYPNTVRLHLSMACNHCLEPSCLEGCPVDAYEKRSNGVVVHDADTCIGCQYCTWNCPYGVPQYHRERRVVTKCDLCVNRLSDGQAPACVVACPTGAIEIEAVDVERWREQIEHADAPGVPPADLTLSTTRITLPQDMPESMGTGDGQHLAPASAHWSLVIFLVLSQWSVGVLAATILVPAADSARSVLSAVAFLIGQLSLVSALFHLGRPIHAWRAIRAWRHSWLSREVIAFGLYSLAGVAPVVLGALSLRGRAGGTSSAWMLSSWSSALSVSTAVVVGVAGIACSVGIYRIPARPAWDSLRTPVSFFATALLLGALSGVLVLALGFSSTSRLATGWTLASTASLAAVLAMFTPWQLVLRGLGTKDAPLLGAALLLTRRFPRLLWSRTLVLTAVATLAPISVLLRSGPLAAATLTLACFAEIAGRYLFFVTVVPRNMPGSFFAAEGARPRS